MITQHDLEEAIAECQGVRSPNASTCVKLAAFYIIRKEMFGGEEQIQAPAPVSNYSYDSAPDDTIKYEGESEFAKSILGRSQDEMWALMDELMQTLQIVDPRLYKSVLRKIND